MKKASSNHVRAVVVTKDGKRYLTPWRGNVTTTIRNAERLIERKKLEGCTINGMIRRPKEDRSERSNK